MNDSIPEQNQSDIVESALPNLTVGGQNLSDLPNSDIVDGIKSADTLPENCFSHTLPTFVSCVLPEKDFIGNNSTLEAVHLSENFDKSNTQHHLKESENTPLKTQDQSSSSPKEPVISKSKTRTPTVSNWQHSWARFGFKIEPKEERNSSSLSSPADINESLVPSQYTTKATTSYVKNDGFESFDDDKTPKPETLLNPGSEEKADGHHGLELPLGYKNQPFTTGSLIHYSWGLYFAFIN